MLKALKYFVLTFVVMVFLFLFTRPAEYRNLARNVSGTLENQWCAWTALVGHKCDRRRHARWSTKNGKKRYP